MVIVRLPARDSARLSRDAYERESLLASSEGEGVGPLPVVGAMR
jgi:hypothetical protein